MQWHEDFFLQAHDELSVRHIFTTSKRLPTHARSIFIFHSMLMVVIFMKNFLENFILCVLIFFNIQSVFEGNWMGQLNKANSFSNTWGFFSVLSLNNNNNEWEEQEEPRASGARLWRRKPIILMENGEHPTMENCFLVYVQLFSTENYFSCLRLVHLITEEWNSFHISSRENGGF